MLVLYSLFQVSPRYAIAQTVCTSTAMTSDDIQHQAPPPIFKLLRRPCHNTKKNHTIVHLNRSFFSSLSKVKFLQYLEQAPHLLKLKRLIEGTTHVKVDLKSAALI